MKSRDIAYYAPQTRRSTPPGGGAPIESVEPELQGRDRLLVIADYTGPKPKGKDLPVHTQWYKKYASETFAGSFVDRQLDGASYEVTGPLGQVVAPNAWDLDYTAALNLALDRCYEQARGNTNIGIDLMQYRQAIQLGKELWRLIGFIRTFNIPRLYKSYEAFQKLRRSYRRHPPRWKNVDWRQKPRRDWRDPVKGAAGYWLTYSYGARPLMQSVYGAIEELTRPRRRQFRATGTSTKVSKTGLHLENFLLGGVGDWTYRGTSQSSIRVKYAMDFVFDDAIKDVLGRLVSFNPVSYIYENIPFSFVVDWALDIGGFMEIYESALKSRCGFKRGHRTITFRCSAAGSVTRGPGDANTAKSGYAKSWDSYSEKYRDALSSPPLPILPGVRNPGLSNAHRALNAIALLAQRFHNPRG